MFNARIRAKYDIYENWMTNDPTPLEGELCVVIVPVSAGVVAQEPAILFKVGDGTSTFRQLSYSSAKAADVYDWAKAAVKPAYTADEIEGLTAYISGEIQNSDTQYKLEQDDADGHILKLYSKSLSGSWTLITTITTADTVYDDTALAQRVSANEADITVLNGTGDGSVAKQVSDAVAAVVANAPGDFDTLKEIADWITNHADSAAAMNSQIQTNVADISALALLVGDVAVATRITNAISALDLDSTYATATALGALAGRVSSLETAIAGKVDEEDLADVATSGNITDLTQTSGDYVVFCCGSSSEII